jgi:type IV pilus assembly protein PilO
MPDLRQTRKKLKIAMMAMAAVDVLALLAYFSPLIGSPESHRQQMNQLETELRTKTREVEPLRNLPQKVVLAHRQITEFYKDRLPAQSSQIAAEFGKLAAAENVTIDAAKYTEKDIGGGLQSVLMEANLAGNYVALAKFINSLERDQMFFIIKSLQLGGQQQGPVKLEMKLETYLKAGQS